LRARFSGAMRSFLLVLHVVRSSPPGLSLLDEDENIIIQNSQKIGLSPRYYEELEYIHSINGYRLNITAYRVKPPNGGKRKRKTRKTLKLRKKSKLRKRTRRYKHLK
jgi:hypothetical protein